MIVELFDCFKYLHSFRHHNKFIFLIDKTINVSTSKYEFIRMQIKIKNYCVSYLQVNKTDKFKLKTRKSLTELNFNNLTNELRRKKTSLISHECDLCNVYVYDNYIC